MTHIRPDAPGCSSAVDTRLRPNLVAPSARLVLKRRTPTQHPGTQEAAAHILLSSNWAISNTTDSIFMSCAAMAMASFHHPFVSSTG